MEYFRGCRGELTPIIAFFTFSSLMRPTLNRFSTNSILVEPEQYHAMEERLLVIDLKADFIAACIGVMQSVVCSAVCIVGRKQ